MLVQRGRRIDHHTRTVIEISENVTTRFAWRIYISEKRETVKPAVSRYYPCGASCEGRSAHTSLGTPPGFAWQGPCAATSPATPSNRNRATSASRNTIRVCCVATSSDCSLIECHQLAHSRRRPRQLWSNGRTTFHVEDSPTGYFICKIHTGYRPIRGQPMAILCLGCYRENSTTEN